MVTGEYPIFGWYTWIYGGLTVGFTVDISNVGLWAFQPTSFGYVPSGKHTKSYGQWPFIDIYSEFTHEKWWFSIAMLVYQRVYFLMYSVVDTHRIHRVMMGFYGILLGTNREMAGVQVL